MLLLIIKSLLVIQQLLWPTNFGIHVTGLAMLQPNRNLELICIQIDCTSLVIGTTYLPQYPPPCREYHYSHDLLQTQLMCSSI